MALKVVHDSLEEIPEAQQELYSEQGGKFVLTGISGVKTQDDITRLQTSLNKEREDHKTTKSSLALWADMDHEDVVKKLDRFTELETAAADKVDDSKLEEMAEARARTRLAPIERENKKLLAENTDLKDSIGGYKKREIKRKVGDTVTSALVDAKIIDAARSDALLLAQNTFEVTEDGQVLTREGSGVTVGLDPKLWLEEIMPKRPHWLPGSQGGGARGSGAGAGGTSDNPWTDANWNLTQQGKVIKEHGDEKAERMAKAAGSFIGATSPPKK